MQHTYSNMQRSLNLYLQHIVENKYRLTQGDVPALDLTIVCVQTISNLTLIIIICVESIEIKLGLNSKLITIAFTKILLIRYLTFIILHYLLYITASKVPYHI